MVRPLKILLAAAVTVALLVGCEETDPDGEGANVVDTEGGGADEGGDEGGDDNPLGTRQNPLEVGTTIEVVDWTVTVTKVQQNANDAVAKANEFNEDPIKGRQFVMWSVDATYTGEDSGDAWIDLQWAFVGAEGNSFGTGQDDYCGVIPKPLNEAGEAFPDAKISGNVCVSVPSKQVKGGVVQVEELLGEDRAFYALK